MLALGEHRDVAQQHAGQDPVAGRCLGQILLDARHEESGRFGSMRWVFLFGTRFSFTTLGPMLMLHVLGNSQNLTEVKQDSDWSGL